MLPFDPRLSLKKVGRQSAPALKTQKAAAAGAKMSNFTFKTSGNFHGIDRRRQKCGNGTYICPISHGVIGQQLRQLLPAGVAPSSSLLCQSLLVPRVLLGSTVHLIGFHTARNVNVIENQQFCCSVQKSQGGEICP